MESPLHKQSQTQSPNPAIYLHFHTVRGSISPHLNSMLVFEDVEQSPKARESRCESENQKKWENRCEHGSHHLILQSLCLTSCGWYWWKGQEEWNDRCANQTILIRLDGSWFSPIFFFILALIFCLNRFIVWKLYLKLIIFLKVPWFHINFFRIMLV